MQQTFLDRSLCARVDTEDGTHLTGARSYVCPHCGEPLDIDRAESRLDLGKTDLICDERDKKFLSVNVIEEKISYSQYLAW